MRWCPVREAGTVRQQQGRVLMRCPVREAGTVRQQQGRVLMRCPVRGRDSKAAAREGSDEVSC